MRCTSIQSTADGFDDVLWKLGNVLKERTWFKLSQMVSCQGMILLGNAYLMLQATRAGLFNINSLLQKCSFDLGYVA